MFRKLAGRVPRIMDQDKHESFAVLLPVLEESGNLLFEVRADKLLKQPSEICFPGGRIEPGETPEEAAVRELAEELLVLPNDVEVIAPLDVLINLVGSAIYPSLGYLRGYRGTFNEHEVKEVFEVPFEFFLKQEPLVHTTELTIAPSPGFPHDLIGTEHYPWQTGKNPVLFYLYEDKVIWGLTARILHNAVELMTKSDKESNKGTA
jgi:8-oxo-dGTP pyrophosphatase MutT (NUDIX family)